MRVDCFKTDFGERIPTDVSGFDGSDPQKMHNHYAFIYNELVWKVLKETVGEQEAVLFARSASVGAQQFPVHWGGDCYANYDRWRESLRGGLSIGMSGFGFWSRYRGFQKTPRRPTSLQALVRLRPAPATAGCTAANPIGCHGATMTSPATWCATSHS